MDISTQQHWGQEIYITGNTIPTTKIGGITLVQTTVQGKTCYTITLPGYKELYDCILRGNIEEWALRDLGSLIISQLTKNVDQIEIQRLQKSWDELVWGKYSNQWIHRFLENERGKYGDIVVDILREISLLKEKLQIEYTNTSKVLTSMISNRVSTLWNKEDIVQAIELLVRLRAIWDNESRSTIEKELIAQIPESLREEGINILSDEKMRRKLIQDILTVWVRSLWKRWINVALVTLGGETKADGWLVLEIPAILWQESFFVIAIRWKTLIVKTFEDGLDILSKENVSPVFTHYLVDLNGDILGEVTTRLSGKMKDILFPTEARITGWMRHPETLPKGTEIWFRYGNEGKSISITHLSNAGWFTETGISESSLDSLTIMASHLTIWYVKHGEYGWFQAHYTGTRIHAYGPTGERNIHGRIASMSGYWNIFRGDSWNAWVLWAWEVWVQSAGTNTRNIDTARIEGRVGIFVEGGASPFEFKWSYEWIFAWRPNAFPNTKYTGRLTNKERNFWNIPPIGYISNLSLGYNFSWGRTSLEITREVRELTEKNTRVIQLILSWGYFALWSEWAIIPKHPLLSHQTNREVGIGYRSKSWSVDVWLRQQEIGGRKDTSVSLGLNAKI